MELPVRVIPSEEKPPDKRIKKIKYELPKIPSNMFFLGRCGSGKSSALYSMLNEGYTYTTKKGGKKKSVFDEMLIFLGTLDSDKSFSELPCKNIVILHEFNPDDFEAYLEDLKKHQMERLEKKKPLLNVCIVFDDFIGNSLMKSRNGKASPLEHLMLRSRHECNATVMFCSQTYKHQSFSTPTIRNNINYYLLFSMSRSDVEKVAEENMENLTKDEFIDLYYEINKQPYQFMIIDKKKQCFRRGFTEVVHSFHEEEAKKDVSKVDDKAQGK